MKRFTMKFALADSEYMTAVRLAVGGVCAAADLDVDAAEDCKVCVTESCLILKNCGFEEATVSLCAEQGVCAEVCGLGGEPKEGDNEFSLALVSALVEECDIVRKGAAIEKVILRV